MADYLGGGFMKKLLLMMILCLVMMSNSVNLCSANLKDYYDNNPDYVHVATGHFIVYLYLPSIDVQEYNPPYYQIAGKFVGTDGYDRKRESIEIVRFNWYTKETFHKNKYGKAQNKERCHKHHSQICTVEPSRLHGTRTLYAQPFQPFPVHSCHSS